MRPHDESESLFPVKDDELLDAVTAERQKEIQGYKHVVFELLEHYSLSKGI